MFVFRHAGHRQKTQIIIWSTHALVVAVTGNTSFIVCRTSPLCARAPSRWNICLTDSGPCVNCPTRAVFRKLLYVWADQITRTVANGNDPDATSSNFKTEVDLISRLADRESINFVHNGLLWALHTLSRVKHFRMYTDCARRAHRQRFGALPIRKNCLRRRQLCGSRPARCNWSSRSTSNILCLNKFNSPATCAIFYMTDVAPQLLLWPHHCLVSVLFVGHLPSQVSQVLRFIPCGDAVQSSEHISVWMKATRITQHTFSCTNSHDYHRHLGSPVVLFVVCLFYDHYKTSEPWLCIMCL